MSKRTLPNANGLTELIAQEQSVKEQLIEAQSELYYYNHLTCQLKALVAVLRKDHLELQKLRFEAAGKITRISTFTANKENIARTNHAGHAKPTPTINDLSALLSSLGQDDLDQLLSSFND
jgi:thiamine biosynthesis lipoprotein ApbE